MSHCPNCESTDPDHDAQPLLADTGVEVPAFVAERATRENASPSEAHTVWIERPNADQGALCKSFTVMRMIVDYDGAILTYDGRRAKVHNKVISDPELAAQTFRNTVNRTVDEYERKFDTEVQVQYDPGPGEPFEFDGVDMEVQN